MKTFRTSKSRVKKLWMERVARMNAARERKRLERTANEPIREEWRGRLEWTITIHNRQSNTMHTLDLYRSQRRDQYDAKVDGKPWRTINATELSRLLRKKLCPHIQN
jgi:hypothetical protein